jgi:hypothetical protein
MRFRGPEALRDRKENLNKKIQDFVFFWFVLTCFAAAYTFSNWWATPGLWGKSGEDFSYNRKIQREITEGTIFPGLGIPEVPLDYWPCVCLNIAI